MALATKCPHCNTIFRVAADQLKLRGGIVRCGSCALVFDGNAALVEPAPKPTPVIPEVVAETPPPKPAISDYVHGSPVDFEIDFGEEAAAPAPQPPAAKPAGVAPAAAPSPAVWRNASVPAAGTSPAADASSPGAGPAPAGSQPEARTPSPDDIAIAAVARAFAAVTAPAAPASPSPASPASAPPPAAEPRPVAAPSQAVSPGAAAPTSAFAQSTAIPAQAGLPQRAAGPAPAVAPPATRAPSPAPSRSLIDVVSPDAAFTAAAEPSPPLVPEVPTVRPPAEERAPAGPSSLADLVAPDAIFAATAEESPPLAPPPIAKAAPPAGPARLSDVLSPDATFSAATEAAPAAEAPAPRSTFPAAPAPIPAAAPVQRVPLGQVAPPVAETAETRPSQDETPAEPLQVAEVRMPPQDAGLADQAVSPGDSEAAPPQDDTPAGLTQITEERALPHEAAPGFELPSHADAAVSPDETEAAPLQDETPAELPQFAEEHALPHEAALAFVSPVQADQAGAPAETVATPPQEETPAELAQASDERTLQQDAAPAFAAPSDVDQADSPAGIELPPQQDEAPAEPAQAAEASAPLSADAFAFDAPSHADHVDSPAGIEAEAEPTGAAPDTGEQTGASLLDALDQWSADNTPADGRLEPSLDTPQEHVVVAALDDAHHFEDLPAADDAGAAEASEPSLHAEPWPAADAVASEALGPSSEAWSLSEPDETALHAVAAVNTDAPDDGASVTDDEPVAPVEPPAKSRRERALKRAKSRRDASGPGAEHEVFAIEENGPEQEASADDIAARMRAIAGVDENGEADDLDHSDLSFVKRVDRSQRYGKAVTITMAVGVPILLAGLVLQAATTFRDTLAANYPQLKPALAAVCQPLGCKIALPTQLDALSVEPGELASMTENTFSFSTVLRNQSKTPQAWPHIELTLNDNADKPVLRRVFAPSEYLPSPGEAEKGFGPRSEQSIKLYFELKELKASGYHIAIFYP